MGEQIFGALVGAVLVIVPLWRIFARAGFNPALSLLVIIPLLGFIIVTAVLGFSKWPRLENHNPS